MAKLNDIAALLPVLVMALAAAAGALRGVDVFDALCEGVREGLGVCLRIFPTLVALLTAVGMLRASGLLDALTGLLSPLLALLGIPPETAPLMLLRPISGSGALAVAGWAAGQRVVAPVVALAVRLLGKLIVISHRAFPLFSVPLWLQGVFFP